METSTTQIMYPIIFAFCYMLTIALIGYIAYLVYKRTSVINDPDNELNNKL